MSPYTHFGVQFPLHWFAYLYSTPQSIAIWYLYSEAVSIVKLVYLYFSTVSLWSSNTCILASSFVITHIHFYPQIKRQIIFKQKRKKTLKSFGTDRICNQREATTSFLHTLHPIILFLPFNFFFLPSVYPLLLLLSLLLTPLYLCLFSLRLWSRQ